MDNQGNSSDRIMISYRREDSAAITGRIYDRLVLRYSREAIFKDVDSIPLGANFKQHLDSVITQCGVLLVVIGHKWLNVNDIAGKRRLNNPRDVVRIEIESALQRNIPVIPLLVQNTMMPADADLPPTLKELAYRNGTVIGDDPHFHDDMDRLIRNLDKLLPPSSDQAAQAQPHTAAPEQTTVSTSSPEINQPVIISKGKPQAAPQTAPQTASHTGFLRQRFNRLMRFKDSISKAGLKLIIPIVIIVILIVEIAIKNSDVYHLALTSAQNNQTLIDLLGEPIAPGWLVQGTLSTDTAGFSLSLKGQKAKGKIYIDAIKEKGVWTLSSSEFVINGTNQRIDLLSN